jgi:DNA-binding response OmpR family regulator
MTKFYYNIVIVYKRFKVNKNILIVEDDLNLSLTLSQNLSNNHLFYAQNLSQAFQIIFKNKIELIILDLHLENNENGLDLLSYLQNNNSLIKVIILSSQAQLEDRIIGLRKGADDYLAKPFSLIELKLKIEKILNLSKKFEKKYFKFNNLVFNLNNYKLSHGEKKFSITFCRKEGEILEFLMKNKNLAITKNTLINSLWCGDKIPLESSIDVYIQRIRKKLGKYKNIIRTKRNVGYYFSPDM